MVCSLQVNSSAAFTGTPVTDLPRNSLGLNQQTYERLRVALSLNLRRQIFIAVCDDLPLRDRLAMQLQSELASEVAAASMLHSVKPRAIPRLVTLDLNLDDPNPIAQITEWLSYFPLTKTGRHMTMPAFQLLGIERLTRQSAELQSVFLAYLQNIEQELPSIESGLLLWMTKPWFRMLPEAVPEFWHCRTGIFEFIGDPTPLPTSSPERIQMYSSSRAAFSGSMTESRLSVPPPSAYLDPSATDTDTDTSPEVELSIHPSTHPPIHSPIQPSNPWLPLAADLTTWYEPNEKNSASSATELPQQALPQQGFNQESNQGWMAAVGQLEQELKITNWQGTVAPGQQRTETQPFSEPQPQFNAASVSVAALPFPILARSLEAEPNSDSALISAPPSDLAARLIDADPLSANSASVAEPKDGAGGQPVPLLQPVDLLQHIDLLQQQIALLEQGQESTTGVAIAYRTLGNFYRDCIEQGEASAENLTSAIQAYEQALHWLPEGAAEQAETLNDLGNLYWMVSQYQSGAAEAIVCLQQTEQIYQQALAHLTLPQQSQTYAMVQNNLGAVYADLARYQEPAANLQHSVAAYQQALQYRTADFDPIRYASTQNNLGTTYWNLAQHEQAQLNLKQAILAYSAALHYYDPSLEPLTHAMIQNNLGTAYWNLAQYEQAQDYLILALTAYRAALKYRTLETVPASFAATQNNLGTAYWHLANHTDQNQERVTYLQQAITAYKSTLEAADYLSTEHLDATLNFDPSSTHNNLGLAHYQLAIDIQAHLSVEAQSHHLASALQHHLAALKGWELNPDLQQTAFNCILQTVRAFYTQLGLLGQNQALAQIPGHLLPEILPKL